LGAKSVNLEFYFLAFLDLFIIVLKVSDFIGTFQQQEEEKYHLQILKFFPELNQVVGE
jgi:hypothetical protein